MEKIVWPKLFVVRFVASHSQETDQGIMNDSQGRVYYPQLHIFLNDRQGSPNHQSCHITRYCAATITFFAPALHLNTQASC